jgi:preprotein translocase subunit SecE
MAQSVAVKGSRFKFFGNVIAELKKVVWLSRRDALYLTLLVLVISIVAGLILGFLDLGFTHAIDKIIIGG